MKPKQIQQWDGHASIKFTFDRAVTQAAEKAADFQIVAPMDRKSVRQRRLRARDVPSYHLGWNFIQGGASMWKKVCAIIALSLSLSNCSPPLRSTVTSFHKINSEEITGKKISILPEDVKNDETIEFSFYRDILAKKFSEKGLIVVSNSQDVDWIAFIDYKIDSGENLSRNVSIPQTEQVGGGLTYHSGTVYSGGNSARYSGTSYSPPVYATTGYRNVTINETIYTRNISIIIYDKEALSKKNLAVLYEGHIISKGSCASLASVFSGMSDALFQEWPGPSGESKTIEIQWNGKC